MCRIVFSLVSDGVEAMDRISSMATEAKSKVAHFDSEIKRCLADMSITEHAKLVEQVASAMTAVARMRAKLDSAGPPSRDEHEAGV